MHLRLLLSAALLFSTLGCSKKEDPAPPPATSVGRNEGHYVYNGRPSDCTATALVQSSIGVDVLTIVLTTTPQPATGPEALRLIFRKDSNRPVSGYTPVQLHRVVNGMVEASYGVTSWSVTSSPSGGYSGTFSSNNSYLPIPVSFTDGTFTDVRP